MYGYRHSKWSPIVLHVIWFSNSWKPTWEHLEFQILPFRWSISSIFTHYTILHSPTCKYLGNKVQWLRWQSFWITASSPLPWEMLIQTSTMSLCRKASIIRLSSFRQTQSSSMSTECEGINEHFPAQWIGRRGSKPVPFPDLRQLLFLWVYIKLHTSYTFDSCAGR